MEEISLKDLIKILLNGYKLIIIITACIAIVSIFVWLTRPRTFVSEVSLKVSPIDINPSISSDTGSLIGDISSIARFPVMDINTYAEQVISNDILEKAIAALNLYDEDGILLQPVAIKNRISVKSDEKTNIIYISASDSNAQGAADLANTLVNCFIAHLDNIIQNSCNDTLSNLDRQLTLQKQKLDIETANLKQYSEAPINALVIDSSIRSLITQITQYKADLNDLQRKLDSGKKALTSFIDLNSSRPVSNFKLSTPYSITNSSETSSTIEMDLSGDIGNAVMALKKAEIETGIIQNESEYDSLSAIIATMETDLSQLQAIAAEEQQKYNILQMKYSLAGEIYSKYQKIYQQIPVIAASGIAEKNIMILSEATPPNTFTNASMVMYLAIGTVLGLFIGAFCVLFRSYWTTA